MTTRTAACRCGQLCATVTGDPVRVSVCHCLDCKKRSGSAFAVQARWPADQVGIKGHSKKWVNIADSGNRITFHFCPECGSRLFGGKSEQGQGITASSLDDPSVYKPQHEIWTSDAQPWDHMDPKTPKFEKYAPQE